MWIFKSKDELKHYASKYYDPIKAHLYYEEHKELKGRKAAAENRPMVGIRSTKSLDDKGKAEWAQIKKDVASARKAALRENTLERQAILKEFRGAAKEKQNAISTTLKNFLASLSKQQKERARRNSTYYKSQIRKSKEDEKKDLEAIAKDKEQKLERLKAQVERTKTKIPVPKRKPLKKRKPVPKGASEAQRAAIAKQNERIAADNDRIKADNDRAREAHTAAKEKQKAETDAARERTAKQRSTITKDAKEKTSARRDEYRQIREDYKEESDTILYDIREGYSDQKVDARESAKQQKERIKEELSNKIEQTRNMFSDRSEEIKESFEAVLDDEYMRLIGSNAKATSYKANSRTAAEKKAIREQLAEERKKSNKK